MGKPNFLALMGEKKIALLVQTVRKVLCTHGQIHTQTKKAAHVHMNTHAHKHKNGRREGGGREVSPGAYMVHSKN